VKLHFALIAVTERVLILQRKHLAERRLGEASRLWVMPWRLLSASIYRVYQHEVVQTSWVPLDWWLLQS